MTVVMDYFGRAENLAMLRFLKATWLPTAMFVGVSGLIDRDKGLVHWVAVMAALILVPLIWKSFVIRQGRPRVRRAVLAGSASAFMIMWSEEMVNSVGRFLHQGQQTSEELGGLLVILVPFMTLIGYLLGAGIGLVAAITQARLWPDPCDEPGTADPTLDGAVGGALVATLTAPFVAIPFAALMPNPQAPGMNLFTATAGTWVILASAGAWLGSSANRRWKRVLGQGRGDV